jgi:hypothetical protein
MMLRDEQKVWSRSNRRLQPSRLSHSLQVAERVRAPKNGRELGSPLSAR